MTYKIKIDKKVQKFINKQDRVKQQRIYKAIYNLPNGDVKKMRAKADIYRLRVGEFRFVYTINNNEILITIIDADNRGDIYKNY